MIEQIAIITAIIVPIMTALLVYMVNSIKRNQEASRWNSEKNRIELSLIRKELELKQLELVHQLQSTRTDFEEMNHLIISSQKTMSESDFKRKSNIQLNNFLRDLGVEIKDIKFDPKLIFVLTPFNNYAWKSYKAIQDTTSEFGFRAIRGDEEYIEGDIFPQIIKNIINARIIIANITGRNPNVFYELGIAHMLDKPIIIISEFGEKVEFDIKSKYILFYENVDQLKSKLNREISKLVIEEQIRNDA